MTICHKALNWGGGLSSVPTPDPLVSPCTLPTFPSEKSPLFYQIKTKMSQEKSLKRTIISWAYQYWENIAMQFMVIQSKVHAVGLIKNYSSYGHYSEVPGWLLLWCGVLFHGIHLQLQRCTTAGSCIEIKKMQHYQQTQLILFNNQIFFN